MAITDRMKHVDYAFWVFVLSVALLPVGLGGNRALPFGLAQGGLCLSCLFLVTDPDDFWKDIRLFNRLKVALILFAAVALYTLVQIQPLVPAEWKHPLWQEAAAALSTPVYGAISVSPEDSIKGLSRLFTYVACGLLAYLLAQEPRRARRLIEVFWYSGVALCAYGLAMYVAGLHKILWLDKWAYHDDLTATFVNHNHFAIYADMVLVCGLALLLQSWMEGVQRKKKHQKIEAFNRWLVEYGLLQSALLIMVLMCVAFSHSRAGLVLALGGLGSYLFFYQIYMRAWGRAFLFGVAAVTVPLAVLLFAMHASEHFAALFTDFSSLDRLKVYQLAWHALQDNPWLGYGLNGFEPEFRLYQQNMIMEFNHVHDDWLESMLDLGIPVAMLLWAAIGLALSGLAHGIFYRRQNGMYPAIGLAASVIVLAHGFVDFSLQIPGVVMLWAALTGTGLGQSWKQAERTAVGKKAVPEASVW